MNIGKVFLVLFTLVLILPAKTLLLCNILWGFFGGGVTFMKSKINVTHVKFKYSPISYL